MAVADVATSTSAISFDFESRSRSTPMSDRVPSGLSTFPGKRVEPRRA